MTGGCVIRTTPRCDVDLEGGGAARARVPSCRRRVGGLGRFVVVRARGAERGSGPMMRDPLSRAKEAPALVRGASFSRVVHPVALVRWCCCCSVPGRACTFPGLHESCLVGEDHCLYAVAHLEFHEDAVHMRLDGCGRDDEFCGDLVIG